MACRFSIVDVFTEQAFAGNPLAVVRDCDHLNPDQMQAIAREFNLSETAFVLAPRDRVNSARLRIFTPRTELMFAGHPTIGSAVLIAMEDAPDMIGREGVSIVLEEGIGPVRCEVRRPRGRAVRAVFEAPAAPVRKGDLDPAACAAALGLEPGEIGFDGHRPVVYDAGVSFAFVPLASLEAAARAAPGPAFHDAITACAGASGCFVYTRETAGDAAHVHARMFAPDIGVPEDPATGSAAAAFAGVCMEFERPDDGEHQILIEQGMEMGRPSEMALTMTVQGGALSSVSIGGAAVVAASGTLRL